MLTLCIPDLHVVANAQQFHLSKSAVIHLVKISPAKRLHCMIATACT